jgi:hypothetical protein
LRASLTLGDGPCSFSVPGCLIFGCSEELRDRSLAESRLLCIAH